MVCFLQSGLGTKEKDQLWYDLGDCWSENKEDSRSESCGEDAMEEKYRACMLLKHDHSCFMSCPLLVETRITARTCFGIVVTAQANLRASLGAKGPGIAVIKPSHSYSLSSLFNTLLLHSNRQTRIPCGLLSSRNSMCHDGTSPARDSFTLPHVCHSRLFPAVLNSNAQLREV
jgi:hypothetical protein